MPPEPPRSSQRSVVTYTTEGDPWPAIATWAQKHQFDRRTPQTDPVKLFEKGSGLWTAPMRVQFTRTGSTIEVQAWVQTPRIVRILSLFLLPAEMNVRSGGYRGSIPRGVARKAVNELLAQVGAEPIA